jgi:hypothetical protein
VRDLFAIMGFLGVKPLDDRDYWRRLLERPLKMGDERGLMRLQARPGGGGRAGQEWWAGWQGAAGGLDSTLKPPSPTPSSDDPALLSPTPAAPRS